MEYFDVYPQDRIPTGETRPRNGGDPREGYRLAIHVCLFSGDGRMLIQRRQTSKRKWSGLWDLSVAGSAVAGETSRDAAMRETREELGLEIDLEHVRPVLTVHWDRGFDDVFVLRTGADPADLRLQAKEVLAARWASLEEILSMIRGGSFIPYEESFIRLLFSFRERRDIHTRADASQSPKN